MINGHANWIEYSLNRSEISFEAHRKYFIRLLVVFVTSAPALDHYSYTTNEIRHMMEQIFEEKSINPLSSSH